MLRRVAIVTTDVSEERVASIIRVTGTEVLEATLGVTGGDTFFRNAGYYKSHTA
jgi:hypothetical protein